MKDKFLKLGLFGTVLLFMAVFLNSCQKDDFDDENLKESRIKLETVTLEDILQKPKHNKFRKTFTEFKETYATLENKGSQNILGKFVYNEEFGFYIDDSNGRYIEKDGHHSYTFRIIRLESDDKVENIVFNYKSDGEYYITLAKYDI